VQKFKSHSVPKTRALAGRVRGFVLLIGLLSFGSGLQANDPDMNWELSSFVRPEDAAPIISPVQDTLFKGPLSPTPVHWESLHTFNPGAIVRDGKIYMLYRAEDDSGQMKIGGHTSRIGLAISEDGVHFQREPKPVLYPADDDQKSREWPGGCEDPRVVEAEDGTYVVAYTQWNHRRYDAAIATSKDLHSWEKHGPAFAKAYRGKYKNLQYKSMGIVTSLQDGRLKAAKVKGKYLMYWGEGKIHLARSENLIDWDPVEDETGKLVTVLERRPHLFDSRFPEVGPPPILTERGILLMYNGKNAAKDGDKTLAAQTYSVGEALFSAHDPSQLLNRVDQPVFKPELPWERSGQYVAGTTFVQGLVYYHDKWFLYYGCADSLVGVAMSDHRAL
jgi:beta-1,2-mannosidase